MSAADIERFWSKVNKNGPLPDQSNPHYKGLDNCWDWTTGFFISGYGQFSIKRHPHRAHRVAYWLEHGELPSKGLVCHRCDRASCCNPSHLFNGTWKDNSDDICKKGRRNPAKGENCGYAKHPEKFKKGEECSHSILTENEVRQIRLMHQIKKSPLRVYEKLFNTTYKNAWCVIHYISWKHVLPELNPKRAKATPTTPPASPYPDASQDEHTAPLHGLC